MAGKLSLKHPLSAPVESGLHNLERLGLKAEASMGDDIEAIQEYAGVLISAHAPVTIGALRLNYGAPDEDFRNRSIAHIIDYIEKARQYPNVRQINMHPGPRHWLNEEQTEGRQGDYDLMIDGIRQIAAHAAEFGLEIVLENNNAYWAGVPDETALEDVDWSQRNISFGSAPEEWIRICEDTDRDNVGLCLDSSHTCTYAHTFDPAERGDVVMRFLAKPHLIRHVHWSDNHLYDLKGRNDAHAVLGQGSLPIELHRGIKDLDATLLLEHFYTTEELEGELEFIADL